MKTPKRGKDIKTQASEYISLYTHAHREKKKKKHSEQDSYVLFAWNWVPLTYQVSSHSALQCFELLTLRHCAARHDSWLCSI